MFPANLENILAEIAASKNIEIQAQVPPYVTVKKGKHTQTVKLGKLLAKEKYTNETIKNLVEQYQTVNADLAGLEIKITREFEEIYNNSSVSSCMTGSHSVSVYAHDPRTALFTVWKDNTLVARTLIRTDTKEYVKVYADNSAYIKPTHRLLEINGYMLGSLEGITLEAVYLQDNYYLCPYLDNGMHVSLDNCDNQLVISACGEVTPDIGKVCFGIECSCCGTNCHEDDIYFLEYSDWKVCPTCLQENYIYCDYLNDYEHKENCVINKSTEELVSEAYAENSLIMAEDGEYYEYDDVLYLSLYEEWHPIENLQEVEPYVDSEGETQTYCLPEDAEHLTGYPGIKDGYYYNETVPEVLKKLTQDLFEEFGDAA